MDSKTLTSILDHPIKLKVIYCVQGVLDLFLANGHPDDMIGLSKPQVQYRMPLLLFRNEGGEMNPISHAAGPVFSRLFPARGLAVGDYDNNGSLDVLISNNGEPPLLLRNNAGGKNHWIGLRLRGTTCNRDAVGARIRWPAGEVERSRLVTMGGSYLSSHDPRVVLGLGGAKVLDWLEIEWPLPSKCREKFTDLPRNGYVNIVEGQGISSK